MEDLSQIGEVKSTNMVESGQLLVAPPAQLDDYWARTAVFLYERSPSNTIGLIVNKPGDRPVSALARHNGLEYDGSEMLYIGGPVNPSALILLHTNDWQGKNTFRITENFSVTSDNSMLPRLCSSDKPKQWKLFLGMSAWTNAQLECEIAGISPWTYKAAWLVAPSTSSSLFDHDPTRSWKKAVNTAIKETASSLFQIN